MPHDFSPEAQAARRAPPNVAALSVKELKTRLRACGIDFTGAVEKADLIRLLQK